jgi:hypothetical protein
MNKHRKAFEKKTGFRLISNDLLDNYAYVREYIKYIENIAKELEKENETLRSQNLDAIKEVKKLKKENRLLKKEIQKTWKDGYDTGCIKGYNECQNEKSN